MRETCIRFHTSIQDMVLAALASEYGAFSGKHNIWAMTRVIRRYFHCVTLCIVWSLLSSGVRLSRIVSKWLSLPDFFSSPGGPINLVILTEDPIEIPMGSSPTGAQIEVGVVNIIIFNQYLIVSRKRCKIVTMER